jgi:hypothetical protein
MTGFGSFRLNKHLLEGDFFGTWKFDSFCSPVAECVFQTHLINLSKHPLITNEQQTMPYYLKGHYLPRS